MIGSENDPVATAKLAGPAPGGTGVRRMRDIGNTLALTKRETKGKLGSGRHWGTTSCVILGSGAKPEAVKPPRGPSRQRTAPVEVMPKRKSAEPMDISAREDMVSGGVAQRPFFFSARRAICFSSF